MSPAAPQRSATTQPEFTSETTFAHSPADLAANATAYDVTELARYARCINASRRVRWEIDADVLRGRDFNLSHKFLPDALSKVNTLTCLSAPEQRLLSQVQGRTYAYIFGLVERYISVKVLELASAQAMGEQVALEGLVRFSDEELKHQELFRRIDVALAERMPAGYERVADPNEVAKAVLSKSNWAVLGLTCHIELFTQKHYESSLDHDASICPVFRDVFRYHWLEECQHAMMDELEWIREDRRLSAAERDRAVDDLIALVGAVDGILQAQAASDCTYFFNICDRKLPVHEQNAVRNTVLAAYRWQYIVSGVQHPHFVRVLTRLINAEQLTRIVTALAPLVASVEGGAS